MRPIGASGAIDGRGELEGAKRGELKACVTRAPVLACGNGWATGAVVPPKFPFTRTVGRETPRNAGVVAAPVPAPLPAGRPETWLPAATSTSSPILTAGREPSTAGVIGLLKSLLGVTGGFAAAVSVVGVLSGVGMMVPKYLRRTGRPGGVKRTIGV